MNLTATSNARNPYVAGAALAAQGIPVFPVNGKQPLTSHGVYDASSDLRSLCRMNWRNANGCGIPTGAASGIDVLDVDVRRFVAATSGPGEFPSTTARDGIATLASLPALPETLAASTPNGGRHYYFRHVEGSRNKLNLAPGLEWFSTGKLVVVPPSQGREWLNAAPIAQAPDWLRVMVLAVPLTPTTMQAGRNSSGPLVTTRNSSSVPKAIYFLCLKATADRNLQRRVRGLWATLAAKRPGEQRNAGLNFVAWHFREMNVDREIAAKLLWTACEANGYLAKAGEDKVSEVINRVLKKEPLQ